MEDEIMGIDLIPEESDLFTDRLGFKKIFLDCLCNYERHPNDKYHLSFYGDGGIGKSALLKEMLRIVEKNPFLNDYLKNEYARFYQGSVDEMELVKTYQPIYYDFEESTDFVHVLTNIRFQLYDLDHTLSLPHFDLALRRYGELTHDPYILNKKPDQSRGSGIMPYIDSILNLASLIPNPVTSTIKKGMMIEKSVKTIWEGVRENFKDQKYKATIDRIMSFKQDGLRKNLGPLFQADLNNWMVGLKNKDDKKRYSLIIMLDTFENITYQNGLGDTDSVWYRTKLPKIHDVICVFAGRNAISEENIHSYLLDNLLEAETKEYFKRALSEAMNKEKQEAQANNVSFDENLYYDAMWKVSLGMPLFAELCVQNFLDGMRDLKEFENIDKTLLIEKYIKYHNSDNEKFVLETMSAITYWNKTDFSEVVCEVFGSPFARYDEAYEKIVASTMIEKVDKENRRYLHRAVRKAIYDYEGFTSDNKNNCQFCTRGIESKT